MYLRHVSITKNGKTHTYWRLAWIPKDAKLTNKLAVRMNWQAYAER